jgi:hypothetical protein
MGAFFVGAATLLAITSGTASATVPVGQTGQVTTTPCSGEFDLIQASVSSGTSYVIPHDGRIVSWTTRGGGGSASLKIFRKLAGAFEYQVIAHEGPHALSFGPNTFPANIPVKGGDLIGLYASSVPNCLFDAASEVTFLYLDGNLADGASSNFNDDGGPGFRVNVSAELDPSSAFTLGTVRTNKKNGTATVSVTVPGPGTLALSGKGVKAQQASRAGTSVAAAGTVALRIKAKGKKLRKLKSTGKVKVAFSITYTPTGGQPNTQARKVKLKKKG